MLVVAVMLALELRCCAIESDLNWCVGRGLGSSNNGRGHKVKGEREEVGWLTMDIVKLGAGVVSCRDGRWLGLWCWCWWRKDAWTWHFSKDGRFDVKSAYNMLTLEKAREHASCSLGVHTFDLNQIWNAKVKIFAWRAIREGVATC